MKKIYISGKYRSSTEWGLLENIRHAEAAAIRLWKQGYAVFCPHKNTAHFGGIVDDGVFLEGDLEFLKHMDAIYMLTNWKQSIGACGELKVAKEDLGKVIGKQGRTARSMRTILGAASTKQEKRAQLEIVE